MKGSTASDPRIFPPPLPPTRLRGYLRAPQPLGSSRRTRRACRARQPASSAAVGIPHNITHPPRLRSAAVGSSAAAGSSATSSQNNIPPPAVLHLVAAGIVEKDVRGAKGNITPSPNNITPPRRTWGGRISLKIMLPARARPDPPPTSTVQRVPPSTEAGGDGQQAAVTLTSSPPTTDSEPGALNSAATASSDLILSYPGDRVTLRTAPRN